MGNGQKTNNINFLSDFDPILVFYLVLNVKYQRLMEEKQ